MIRQTPLHEVLYEMITWPQHQARYLPSLNFGCLIWLKCLRALIFELPSIRNLPCVIQLHEKGSSLSMAQWDLTRKIIPYLDRHLVFPVLLNPSLSEIYKPEDVQLALYDLAKSTDLVDYTLDLYGKVFPGKLIPEGSDCAYPIARVHVI